MPPCSLQAPSCSGSSAVCVFINSDSSCSVWHLTDSCSLPPPPLKGEAHLQPPPPPNRQPGRAGQVESPARRYAPHAAIL
ncbi:hypothetical protein AAFF_G00286040 [Aldrovandia affinis]|uniref:Uncharacterized protein n=1 Tax=Aldrovandia affinis TaxID=143900 RepID=A0AAD7TAH4_9TELE|nr:hypothetical protein AAFF_G00286040 [Aldrovandia affinis]